MDASLIAFVGGGNMASALIGGLRRGGHAAARIVVVEPFEAQRERLAQAFDVAAQASADARLAAADMVVWAVKPQSFGDAAAPCAPFVADALQVSVMAGIRIDRIAAALGVQTHAARIVRAMPNTPALVGRGIAALYAAGAVAAHERTAVEALFAPTGSTLWVEREADLDAVTALSASGPAYVFYFIEAMVQAGTEMGLTAEQSRRLAQETFAGAAALAMQSSDPPERLRERVTSKGGTTHAAICSLEGDGVKAAFVRALHAARTRAEELGR
ncbi:MAG: pyrroline-5-carboxylate reductase [Burkholderiales bacterium]|nr:pyrroline-5-carboxylate reductase [Burkholderiales bacterium]